MSYQSAWNKTHRKQINAERVIRRHRRKRELKHLKSQNKLLMHELKYLKSQNKSLRKRNKDLNSTNQSILDIFGKALMAYKKTWN